MACRRANVPAVRNRPRAARSDGRLWFPTTKGLAYVNPAELKPNLQPPPVMIESVLVDGREQKTNRLDSAWPQAIVIPPGHDRLEIHYTGLNFSAPNEVRFKYLSGRPRNRLDGSRRHARGVLQQTAARQLSVPGRSLQ